MPRNVLSVGTLNPQDWVYYDWGPRQYAEPLLCLHPIVGSAESYYRVILSLAERGYRVISPQLPVYWSAPEFCDGLQSFLDALQVRRVHIYGAGIGGFLALFFASRRPERVSSVALTHAFLSTVSVGHNIVYSPSVLRWLPDILVRNAVRSMFPKGKAELSIAEAAEFVIVRTLSCSRDELASRLALLVTESTVVGRLRVPDDRITMIDVFDLAMRDAAPIVEESKQILSSARRALLKSGGDFPYLANADEVSMHLVVHLRRNAAPPAQPLPVPPPARPRPNAFARRRSTSSPSGSEKGSPRRSGKKCGDGRVAAEQQVMAAERERLTRYAPQLAKVRAFVPDRSDDFLAAVLEDCDGDCDLSVEKIRDGQYHQRFHLKARRKAIREAIRAGRKSGSSEKCDPGLTAGETTIGADNVTAKSEEAITTASDPNPCSPSGGNAAAVDAVSSRAGQGIQNSDEVVPESTSSSSRDVLSKGGHSAPVQSLESVALSDGSGDALGIGGTGAPALSSKIMPTRASGSGKKSIGEGGRRWGEGTNGSDSSKRDRYPPEVDSVSAYVTSERVGMRTTAPLIGRGPAPLAAREQDGCRDVNVQKTEIGPNEDAVADRSVENLVIREGLEGDTSPKSSPRTVDASLPSVAPSFLVPGTPTPPLVHPATRPVLGEIQSSVRDSDSGVVHEPSLTVDDGWGEFRQRGLLAMEDEPGVVQDRAGQGAESEGMADSVDEETARLREWMMSAQSATESVHGVRQK